MHFIVIFLTQFISTLKCSASKSSVLKMCWSWLTCHASIAPGFKKYVCLYHNILSFPELIFVLLNKDTWLNPVTREFCLPVYSLPVSPGHLLLHSHLFTLWHSIAALCLYIIILLYSGMDLLYFYFPFLFYCIFLIVSYCLWH